MDDRGFAPETPVKGGITLDNPGFAIRTDWTDALDGWTPLEAEYL